MFPILRQIILDKEGFKIIKLPELFGFTAESLESLNLHDLSQIHDPLNVCKVVVQSFNLKQHQKNPQDIPFPKGNTFPRDHKTTPPR